MVSWSGRFRKSGALDRATTVDRLRIAGAQITLSFGPVSRQVVIRDFKYDVERLYEVPYTITLEVITGDANATTAPGIDGMIAIDSTSALASCTAIGNAGLTTSVNSMTAAIASAGSLVNAAKATIATVLQPVMQVQKTVAGLISGAETTLTGIATLGGLVPGNPVSQLAASLVSHNSVMGQVSALYDLQAATNRMFGNLTSIGAGGAQVTVAGGNLFTMAQQSYGDATEWATIAKANGITDPVISGIQTILVPPTPTGVQGLLTA